MALKAQYYKHTLNFRFDAGTSRGVLKNKDSYFIKIYDENNPDTFGLGEAGPLEGLSLDFGFLAENRLKDIVNDLNSGDYKNFDDLKLELHDFSSVKFALEMAISDLKNGGKRQIFDNSFFNDQRSIKINGLVWMGEKDFMKKQIVDKLESGFDTIKLKIGAIDFETEMELLQFIRKQFSVQVISIRVDANGAFSPDNALEKLNILSDLNIHSIEQPIKINQWEQMAVLCEKSPIPIALDEELIPHYAQKEELLTTIHPQYIILKPSLMGGMEGAKEWVDAAQNLGINWWLTSALESNIGLNAICQFAAEHNNFLPQGLGTGQLYHNNFDSPLEIQKGEIYYNQNKGWNLDFFRPNQLL